MGDRHFIELLRAQWARGKFVSVGLDTDLEKVPQCCFDRTCPRSDFFAMDRFNRNIVEATGDVAGVFKLNTAFYEEHGMDGIEVLKETIVLIRDCAPDAPVILDAKRADIGNTNIGYARMAFDFLGADAITVNPYLGGESLTPFFEREDKGVIVLCRTSNPDSNEFQALQVPSQVGLEGAHGDCPSAMKFAPLYAHIAHAFATRWNKNGNCAFVVGGQHHHELKLVRSFVGDCPILIPGVGFQQKDVPLQTQVEQVVSHGMDSRGEGIIVNSSRGIIFASSSVDFAMRARFETQKLNDLVNQCRGVVV